MLWQLLSSLENMDTIFEFADPYNPVFHAKNSRSIVQNWNKCHFGLLLPKFGCHGNCPCSSENSHSIFVFADHKTLLLTPKKIIDILYRTDISAILAYFCPNLVAMATSLAPLKIQIAYLNSPSPKTLPYTQKCFDILCRNEVMPRAGLIPNWAWCCCADKGLFSSRHSRQTKTLATQPPFTECGYTYNIM